jgi:hypothetical protein
MDKGLSTWENHDALKQMFNVAPAWGEAGTQAGGNVSTPTIDAPVMSDQGVVKKLLHK